MSKVFGNTDFSPDGIQLVTTQKGYYKDAFMDITVYKMQQGSSRVFCLPDDELALLLLAGTVQLAWNTSNVQASRKTCFDNGENVYGLHVCRNTKVTVTAITDCEFIAQATANERDFNPVYYTPENIRNEVFGQTLCAGTCERRVTTLFDYSNAPYSNMVLGEVYTKQGEWSGYPPHHHPQPEVYYYRVDKPQGFGACFLGDEVYKITDRSFACIVNDIAHPQVTAPGYQIYLVWMIRHLPGNPWVDRIEYPEHEWLKTAEFDT